jgi:outer membrane protein assembly factor BamC
MLKQTLLILLMLNLNACGFLFGDEGIFRDRGGNYNEALIFPPMEVPEELDSYTLDQLYVIPEQFALNLEELDGVPMPKPIETKRREGVIIQNLADRRWVVIDATPGQVWPLVRDYWTELQVILDYENPSSGIMETAWVEVDSDLLTRHKYQITIEPGLHSGYSEIYVRHFENLRSDRVPLIINWPEESSSPDLERQIVDSISQYLADRNDVYQASSASLLAGSIEAERKANIVENDDGEQILQLRIDYARAWVQIRQALESAEIVIVESDRDEKFFNVKFAGIIDEDDEPSLIGRFFGGNNVEVAIERDFVVRLVDLDSTVQIETQELEGTEEPSELPLELLLVINDNLS